jgi:hypothetical protein
MVLPTLVQFTPQGRAEDTPGVKREHATIAELFAGLTPVRPGPLKPAEA